MAIRRLNAPDVPLLHDNGAAAWMRGMEAWARALVDELNAYSQDRDRAGINVYAAGTATSTVLVIAGTATTTQTSTDAIVAQLITDLKRRGFLR